MTYHCDQCAAHQKAMLAMYAGLIHVYRAQRIQTQDKRLRLRLTGLIEVYKARIAAPPEPHAEICPRCEEATSCQTKTER